MSETEDRIELAVQKLLIAHDRRRRAKTAKADEAAREVQDRMWMEIKAEFAAARRAAAAQALRWAWDDANSGCECAECVKVRAAFVARGMEQLEPK